MPDMMQLALVLLQKRNPQALNTPLGQQFAQIVQSGNAQQGEEIARNICNSMGISQEDALNQALNYFSNLR